MDIRTVMEQTNLACVFSACYANDRGSIQERLLNQTLCAFIRAHDEIVYMKAHHREVNSIMLAETPMLQILKEGEGVYIKINDDIISLSQQTLFSLNRKILSYFQETYPINFNYEDFDPIYLALFLYAELPMLRAVRFDRVDLNSLQLLRKDAPPVPLTESESYKALCKGVPCKIYTPFKSNHVVDDDYQRLMESVTSIKQHGYPQFNRYITLYNDEPYIRDGQHRAAVLKYLYGNIEVPVIRLILDGGMRP